MVSIVIEYNGKKISLKELSEKTGIKYQTLIGRYHKGRRGKDLVAPKRAGIFKLYEFKGKMLPMEKIASVLGKKITTVRNSYYRYGNFDYVFENQKSAKARVLCIIDGVKYKASDLTRLFGISRQAVSIHYHTKNKIEFKNWVMNKLRNINKKGVREETNSRRARG
jgi:DNA-binding Xre family transcriptional regulator